MSRSIKAILASFIMLSPAIALAQPVTGLYVGAGVGANFPQDQSLEGRRANLNMRVDPGFAGVGSVGYGYGNGFRAELEGNYRRSNVHSFSGIGTPTKTNGNETNYGAMVNGLYDINIGSTFVYPYVGAGLGWQHSDFNKVSAVGNGVALRSNNGHDDFAYQGIAGMAFPTKVQGLSLTAEYRLRGTFSDGSSYQSLVTTPAGTRSVKLHGDDGLNHSLMLGVRYAFNTPMAATPVAVDMVPVAHAPSRSYLIFFNWDSASLNDRARAIVEDAAQNATHTGVTKIEVNGHTDTSGKAVYNQGLSERRARAVADALVAKGVARDAISIRAYGDTKPVVATGPGVREPQNRRVEIIFH